MQQLGANGGLARYRMLIEPWTAFLDYNRDSTLYQDMTVFDILDSVFQDYSGQGQLNPQWRFDIADRSVYPKRSLTTQYQESDLAFVRRLLSEEGLFGWFEHTGDAQSPSLGRHTFVIADHNEAFKANTQSEIEFAQAGTTIKDDKIDRWRMETRWVPAGVALQSWDYRQINTRAVTVQDPADNAGAGLFQDAPGAYSYETREQGQRHAEHRLQALAAHRTRYSGESTVRTLAPATTFTLNGHAGLQDKGEDESTFLVWRIEHTAHNNLSADLHALIAQNLGLAQPPGLAQDTATNAEQEKGQRPLYRNRFYAIPSRTPYRNPCLDAHGQLLYPKPTVHGQQTAIVVGPEGAVIHTDRDHRVQVQFHWQRGERSHSRLSHPQPAGHSGAPANQQSGTWVRVMNGLAPIAGANWGGVVIPRIGQEVLIDFIEGDIDRPIAIASLYNGQGQANAQHNRISQGTGAATGNAPAWFPGTKEDGENDNGHAHPASLSGLKTQSLNTSQSGSGAYNQLVFDDTPNESRLSLQHHATPHQGMAELNLGFLRHQTDNQRLNKAGFGAELKTRHSAAIRAGQGLLLSTDLRTNATSHQLDAREAIAQLEQSHALQQSLTDTAQKHHAKLKHENQPNEPAPDKLPAILQQQHSLDVLKATTTGSASPNQTSTSDATPNSETPSGGGAGQVPAWSEPQLQLTSPAGITASTPQNILLSAGNTANLTASHDLNLAAQGNHHHLVKNGISLFTYGKADNASKPNTETGIKLHAATGKVSVQSQSDKTTITADKDITVASTQQTITIAAPKHLLMTAQGVYLKLEGGNIMIHGPGAMQFKAGVKELAGPGSSSPTLPHLPQSEKLISADKEIFSQQFDLSHLAYNDALGFSSEQLPYRVYDKAGKFLTAGQTNQDGLTDRILTNEATELVVLVGEGSWQIEEHFEHVETNDDGVDSGEPA